MVSGITLKGVKKVLASREDYDPGAMSGMLLGKILYIHRPDFPSQALVAAHDPIHQLVGGDLDGVLRAVGGKLKFFEVGKAREGLVTFAFQKHTAQYAPEAFDMAQITSLDREDARVRGFIY